MSEHEPWCNTNFTKGPSAEPFGPCNCDVENEVLREWQKKHFAQRALMEQTIPLRREINRLENALALAKWQWGKDCEELKREIAALKKEAQ